MEPAQEKKVESKTQDAASLRQEQEQKLTQFGMNETAEQAIASLPEKEWVSFLKLLHDNVAESYEEEIEKRVQENTTILDEQLSANSKPPYSPETIEAVINIAKGRVMPEVLPKMEEVMKNVRDGLKGKKIEDFDSAMKFQMAIAKISMEYNQLLQKELEEELKSRDLKIDEFMQDAYPQIASDFNFFQDLVHIHSLKIREGLPKDAINMEIATKYIKRSNELNKIALARKINPQAIMVYPNLCEVFLFNELGIEFIQVECFVVDFLNKLGEEKTEKETEFIKLLLEEVFICQKVQILVMMTGQEQMAMMEQMMSGEGGMPQLSESQMEQMAQMFNPENLEAMRGMFEGLDMGKMMEQMPDIQQLMGNLGGQGGAPFPPGAPQPPKRN
mgnify:CR=1 FL=1